MKALQAKGSEEAAKDDKGGKSGEDKGGKSESGKSDKGGGGKSKSEEDKGKSDKDKSDKSEKEPAPKKESEPIEKNLKEITDYINIAGLTTKLDKTLSDLKNHVLNESEEPSVYPIHLVLENLQKAENTIKIMKQEIDKKFDAQVATRVQKRLESTLKENKDFVEKVLKQVKEIATMDQVMRNERISSAKRIAYLGEPVPVAPRGAAQLEQPKEEETVDLFALPMAWDAVQKAIKNITKKPEPKPEPVKPVAPVAPADTASEAPVVDEE